MAVLFGLIIKHQFLPQKESIDIIRKLFALSIIKWALFGAGLDSFMILSWFIGLIYMFYTHVFQAYKFQTTFFLYMLKVQVFFLNGQSENIDNLQFAKQYKIFPEFSELSIPPLLAANLFSTLLIFICTFEVLRPSHAKFKNIKNHDDMEKNEKMKIREEKEEIY